MRIAVPTNDGVSISRHFGRSAEFLFFDVEDKAITARATRSNAGQHSSDAGHAHRQCCEHGEHSHAGVLSTLADCETVICSGIGDGAARALQARGVKIILVQPGLAEEAVSAWLAGALAEKSESSCDCHR